MRHSITLLSFTSLLAAGALAAPVLTPGELTGVIASGSSQLLAGAIIGATGITDTVGITVAGVRTVGTGSTGAGSVGFVLGNTIGGVNSVTGQVVGFGAGLTGVAAGLVGAAST